MKKNLIVVLLALVATSMHAQTATQADVLATAQKVNNYFMAKYADPTLDTNVGRIRPSSLWTRAVYYEGLMALYEIAPDQKYIDPRRPSLL